jgi:quinol-cytochrome oxidoreductase complex cytochrome b subunit
VFLFLLLCGHILLGHFEDYKPKWRRILKVALSVALFLAVTSTLGRRWAWLVFIVPVGIGLIVVHGWWLPKHGINGWTGEPREKYLELVTRRRNRPAA